jgi:hypothetical protein
VAGFCEDGAGLSGSVTTGNKYLVVRFQILMAANMKMTAFWDTVDRRFRGAYCLHHQSPDDGGSNHL